MVMRFPAKKNAGCPKAPRDFPPRKDGILLRRVGLSRDSLSPPPWSVRAYGRTLPSELKFLRSIGYQISLPMVLRSAAFACEGAPLLDSRCLGY